MMLSRTLSRLPLTAAGSLAPLSSSLRCISSTPMLSMAAVDVPAVIAAHGFPGVARATDVVAETASGSFIYGSDGRAVLDCACGIGVTNTGHCHPKVVDAVQKQAAKAMHIQQNIAMQHPVAELMTKLNDITPPALDRFFFNCSGSEAVESAVKLARHATGRPNIVTMQGGFHGRTLGCLSLTSSKNMYGIGYGPFLGGIHRVPFPYCLHCHGNTSAPETVSVDPDFVCCGNPMEQLRLLMKQASAPQDTAAVLIEPLLGEGGYVTPPASYLSELRAFCDEHGILLIADEVQSGFGRTGKMFAIEHWNLVPDILIMAKGMASGMPLAGIAAKGELTTKSPAGSLGGTYGANAVSAAASIATIEVFEEEDILANTNARSEEMFSGLRALQAKHPDMIQDVRGLGLMIGVEFKTEPGIAARVAAAALKRDLLLLTTGAYETIRFIPPLTITPGEVEMVLERFSEACEEVFSS